MIIKNLHIYKFNLDSIYIIKKNYSMIDDDGNVYDNHHHHHNRDSIDVDQMNVSGRFYYLS